MGRLTLPSESSLPSCSFSACSSLHFCMSFLPAIEEAWNWLASSSCWAAFSHRSRSLTCQCIIGGDDQTT